MQRSDSGIGDVIYLIAVAIFTVAALAFLPWVACFAPCDEIGWLPIKDTPARCLVRP